MPHGIKKEEQSKPTLSRRKEIIKTRAEISEIENSKRIGKNQTTPFF